MEGGWCSSSSVVTGLSALGGHLVVPDGWSVALALCGVAAAGAVAGVVLLYLPTTNAYYREIRRLRREARTAEG